MNEQFERAKKRFTSCHGSFLQMHRDGVYEEYKGYGVPQQLELEWCTEMIAAYTRELSISDWKAVTGLQSIARHYQDSTILENVILFTSRHLMSADSIVNLMYAEQMIEIIKLTMKIISNDLLNRAYKVTMHILEDIIAKPLVIDPGHELHGYNLKDKRSLNNRANKSIQELKEAVGLI
jgi:hypothetical protein